jgi:hypothetical protein
VRKSLTQVSHKASHKRRAGASHLTRKDGIYYYRRRLPDHLGTDVALSLGTRNFREAEHSAEALDLIYRRTVNSVTSPADLRTILRAYLESALEDDTTMRLTAPRGRPVYGGREDDHHSPVDVDLETVAHCLSEAQEALAERNFKSVDANVCRLVKQHGLPESARSALAYGVLEAHVKLLEEIERRILGEAPMIFTVDQPGPVQRASKEPAPSGPLFSEALPGYVDLAVKDKG